MFEVDDYMHQKGLGEMNLSKKDNILGKGQQLYDPDKVKKITDANKNIVEIIRKDNKVEKVVNPDENLPNYLKDRRGDLYNPLKENKMTFTEMKIINKMKVMGKWDYQKDGTGMGDDGHPLRKIDSLVESVFNSEKNLDWLKEGNCPIKCPAPSVMSTNDFNLFESQSEEGGDDDGLKSTVATDINRANIGDFDQNATFSKT